jgi:16S rRNA processing protein RimM
VGLVRGLHGLRGEVRVEVLTDHPEGRFKPGAVLHVEGRDDSLTVAFGEPVADGPGWRLRFRELQDRTAVESLRGAYLAADIPIADAPKRGEYYWHEVIGSEVKDTHDRVLGTVRDVYRAGGAEVFVVAGGPAGEFDVPAVRAFVRVFAPRRREIVIDADALEVEPESARQSREDSEASPE